MHPRWVIGLRIALLAVAVTSPARAWQEAHELGQDLYVRVDATGTASIEDKIQWRVVRGPLKSIDVADIDEATALDPTVTVVAEDGRSLLAHLARQDARTLRVTLDEPRPVLRGVLAVDLRWRVDLVASRALVRDTATLRLAWSAPAAVDGYDGARTTFDVPAAPDPPQPIAAATGLIDDSVIASLRRDPGRDILELVRPHVARGESPAWTVRIDPRALAIGGPPAVHAPAASRELDEPDRLREVSVLFALASLAVTFGLLVRAKTRAFASACRARGVAPRALVPIADVPRAVLAGATLALGVSLQVFDRPTLGGFFVAVAVLAAALRSPAAGPVVRGPGRWLALRPSEAFETPSVRGHWLDAGTRPGQVTGILGMAVVAVLARLVATFALEGAWLVALDGAVALPLLVTGCVSQLPPHGAPARAPWLARSFRRLRAVPGLRATPWGRLALDGAIDEVRILVLPRASVPGLIGIEVGQALSSTPVGWTSAPELLVRVFDGSAAAAKLAQVTAQLKCEAVVGRRPEERVVRLTPLAPTVGNTVALARTLAGELADRRVATLECTPKNGVDRRLRPVPPSDVLEPGASAYGA